MANLSHPGPFTKPVKGTAKLARFERRRKARAIKVKATKIEQQAARAKDRNVRWHCYLRDHKRDRITGVPLLFDTDNLLKLAHSHHIVFKSAGGSDEPSNRITIGPKTHKLIHEGFLEVEGNGDELVTVREYTYEGGTRRLLREFTR